MATEWDSVKSGTVIAYVPTGGRQTRRVLVDSVEVSARGIAYVTGVEVTSRYSLRIRRGVHNASEARTFIVFPQELNDTATGSERITNLIAFVQRLRAQRAANA